MTPESKPSVEGKKNEKKVGWALLMVMIIRLGLEKPDNKAGRVISVTGNLLLQPVKLSAYCLTLNSQIKICNSPYCQLYNSHNVSSENLVLD